MNFNKKLNKSGSVTLPSALRREYGLDEGEKFRISVDDKDGSIRLQRIQGQCMFCGSDDRLIIFIGRNVCSVCVADMQDQVKEMGSAE